MASAPVRVDVVIPVYNEEKVLAESVGKLHAYLTEHLAHDWRIVIADNASIDGTAGVAQAVVAQFGERVAYLHLDQKGRGRALRKAWLDSTADIVSYMDVDLSTNLDAFPQLLAALLDEGYDVAIGSRLKRGARVRRQWKREIISRGYNLLVWSLFPGRTFSDAQCGFKALTRRAVDRLVPLVENNNWFFDSELLLRANQLGFRIAEVPVEWVEDLDSRVNIAKTATEDVKGLLRVRFSPP